LRRKLNALSGLFETADDQFDLLKQERAKYKRQVSELISEERDAALESNLNLDNLMAYLAGRFPERKNVGSESASELLGELSRFGYKTLKQLDDVITRGLDAARAYEKKYPPSVDSGEDTIFNPVGIVRQCLDLCDDKYFAWRDWSENVVKRKKEFAHLLKKK
jgi:putative GTP pyrophosphokinase